MLHTTGNAAKFGAQGGRRRARFSTEELERLEPPENALDVKKALARVFCEVREQKVEPKVGNCLAYLATAFLGALEITDLDARLRALEERQNAVRNAAQRARC